MGVQALPLLPPAACIMAWRESYLPPYAPCVMAASGLCLSLLTLTERGGPTAPGWGPQNPWRSDARLEGCGARRCAVRAPATLLPLAATPCPPPVPHPAWGGAARACGSSPRRPLLHYTDSAGRQESGGAPHCPERPPPQRLALEAWQRLAGCCAGGARRPGASYPPPTGVCAHGTGHSRRLGGTTPPPGTRER